MTRQPRAVRRGSEALHQAVEIAVTRLVEATHAEAVILFGSRARGDDDEHSDWDLCVLLPDDVAWGQFTSANLWPLVADLDAAIQVVPIRKSVFEIKKAEINSLSHDIARDGVILYSRPRQENRLSSDERKRCRRHD